MFVVKYIVRYENGELVDEEARGVMMRWEGPLMQAHAQIMCRCIHRFPSRELTLALAQGDVLNVGFGLGLIDTAIQTHNPRYTSGRSKLWLTLPYIAHTQLLKHILMY